MKHLCLVIRSNLLKYDLISGIASEGLKGRVFEVALADLQSETDAERAFRKFKLISEDVQVRNLSTFRSSF